MDALTKDALTKDSRCRVAVAKGSSERAAPRDASGGSIRALRHGQFWQP